MEIHYSIGVFLRRALTRYLGLVVSRLLDKPENGKTGITASIASLLEMARDEAIFTPAQVQGFISEFEEIKKAAAGEYDLVRALRDLRNIHLAHKLIPWQEPGADVAGHHLIEFAEAISNFANTLDRAIAEATSFSLPDPREAANDLQPEIEIFYKALT